MNSLRLRVPTIKGVVEVGGDNSRPLNTILTALRGEIGYTGSIGDIGPIGYVGSQGDIGYTGSQGDTGGLLTWIQIDGPYTASDQEALMVDTSAGSYTVTLPENPVLGDTIKFSDAADWSVNHLFVGRNGSTIEGLLEDFELDIGHIFVDFIFDGITWKVFASVGAEGPQGEMGDLGYTGSRGFTGSQGNIGFTGSQGIEGYTGSQGLIGFTGSQGFVGSQGNIGFTGSIGSQGEIGFTGSQGNIGFTGSRGEIGFTGSTGFIGSSGNIGFTGSAGYTGSQGQAITILAFDFEDEVDYQNAVTANAGNPLVLVVRYAES